MNDQDFIDRIQEKIERLTGRDIELRIDEDDGGQLGVDFDREGARRSHGEQHLPVFRVRAAMYRVCSRLDPGAEGDSGDRVPDAVGQELSLTT